MHTPIGIFDSGIGGLSVLRALQQELPLESFVYLADTAYAPYGERSEDFVRQRALRIAHYLLDRHGIKALVVACNTATVTAVATLRAQLPQLPLVGVEPAIKPAAAATRTGHVGVMATRATVASQRFAQLLRDFGGQVQWHVQACDGLARAIEHDVLHRAPLHPADDPPPLLEGDSVTALCQRYTAGMGRHFGAEAGAIDTLVLGCTHYIFAAPALEALLGSGVTLLDTGAAVARQARRLLTQSALLAEGAELGRDVGHDCITRTLMLSTGDPGVLQHAATRWLDAPAYCCTRVDVR